MNRRVLLWSGAGAALLAAGAAAWVMSLPSAPPETPQPPVPADEAKAMLDGLKPPKRARPVIALIGINEGTETTDYLMPCGILRRADVADVILVSTAPGPVRLFPALRVQADLTVAEFEMRHPNGADYVIVPAMARDDDPAALAFIRRQAGMGAVVIAVCVGGMVVANTGLMDGRRATTHWYYRKALYDRHPAIRRAPDRRMVMDRGVASTTGISASMPMALTLIEAIAGRDKALAVAHDLGVSHWDARHDSDAFRFNRPFALTVMGNSLAFWNRESLALALSAGMDEVALALVADAWSRTYRSRATMFASSGQPQRSRNGIRILPDQVVDQIPGPHMPFSVDLKPAQALDQALRDIAARYGGNTASSVAMQLEYPGWGFQ
jgi:transcriptional regulator GlxA family with amidase domain